ncbi:MAG: hypothetical protein ACPL7B_10995 [Candidatus Poribacteria bacterium]
MAGETVTNFTFQIVKSFFDEIIDDVQKIKKTMIKGSTKSIYKDYNYSEQVLKFESIQRVAEQIERALSNRNWGFDYPRMIREYFGGMYICL